MSLVEARNMGKFSNKKKKHISLENLDTLNGYLDTLTIFIKSYSKRVITLLKQGNKLG